MADQLSSIVASGPQRLATGFGFTEGPVWHPDGHWLFVDIPRNLVYRLAPGGIPEVFRDNSGGSNGLTFDLRGNLIICEGSNRQITRREADGSYTPIANQIDGKHLNHPNDVVGRSDGTLYFTDPTFGMTPEEQELDFAGVQRIAPDGSVSVATRDTELPNGIAFSPDESTLYVHNKDGVYMLAFDVAPDGTISNRRNFARYDSVRIPGHADPSWDEDNGADGMAVDSEGRVYAATNVGVEVFSPGGDLLGVMPVQWGAENNAIRKPQNVAFGGPDRKTLYIVGAGTIFKVRTLSQGPQRPTK